MLVACSAKDGAGGSEPSLAEVGAVTVRTQKLTVTTELPGRTSAYLIADVRPQVSGIILKRLFADGAHVQAGQPLYQLDPRPYQAAYDSAAAALAKAEANTFAARAKASRYEELIKKQLVSQQDYEDLIAVLRQGEADVQAAKANLETARVNLAYTRITAPISGQIESSAVTPGALVTANQTTALTTVQQLNPIYVDVTKSSAEVLRLKRELASGQLNRAGNKALVRLLLEDGSEYAYQGTLEFTGMMVSEKTGSIAMRALMPNPHTELLPGMYVRAILDEGVNDRAIVVPQQGISRDTAGNPTALVVNAQNKVEQRAVQTGAAIRDQWVVSGGLAAGDKLIVQGTQKVKVGDTVKVVMLDGAEYAGNVPGAGTAPDVAAAPRTTAAPRPPAAR
ncbi:MAG: efflux RND transporter periplasmic adaptor subunit [Steroidobacterales bacterium]